MTPAFDEITPHPDEYLDALEHDDAGAGGAPLDLIHERAYVVRAYRRGVDTLVLRGAIRDQKPPGLYVPEDPEPLTVHHMVVELHVAVPSLEITDARVVFETHPHRICPSIAENYRGLIGLSIARGFINKVRELYGGPRGCTHTTALLQAMAPVAIQSMWSFRIAQARDEGGEAGPGGGPMATEEGRERALAMNLGSCHVWAEGGEQVRSIRAGEPMEVPVWIEDRFRKLGLDPHAWRGDG